MIFRGPLAGRSAAVAAMVMSALIPYLAVEAAPTWKGIIESTAEHRATLIVSGAHGRTGLVGT
jgi:hypothetical protein